MFPLVFLRKANANIWYVTFGSPGQQHTCIRNMKCLGVHFYFHSAALPHSSAVLIWHNLLFIPIFLNVITWYLVSFSLTVCWGLWLMRRKLIIKVCRYQIQYCSSRVSSLGCCLSANLLPVTGALINKRKNLTWRDYGFRSSALGVQLRHSALSNSEVCSGLET